RKAFSVWTEELAMDREQETVIGYTLCRALEDSGLRELKSRRWDQAEAAFRESLQVAILTWGESHYRSKDLGFELSLVPLARKWTTAELSNFDKLVALESTIKDQITQANFPSAIDL